MDLDSIRLGVWWVTVTLAIAGAAECFAAAIILIRSIDGGDGPGLLRLARHIRAKARFRKTEQN